MIKNQKLSNRFIILYELGKGAFSKVYKIRRIKDNTIYALKKVPIKNLKKKELENALNEIRILASVKHPNIIGYREAFIDKTSEDLCIIMNYAGGGDLSVKIKECKKKKIRLPETIIIKFFYQLTSALYELHKRKIIHRDLKTANILISEDLKNIYLGDMNVSKIVKNIFAYTQTGTPYYASPEVWRDEPYNVKTDIWSLGCVMYEMCMLRPPFSAVDMDDLFNKVQKCKMQAFDSFYSSELRRCISKLLTVNPHLRPNCEKILNFDIFNDLKILFGSSCDNGEKFEEDVFCNNELIETIKAHKNFFDLGLKLPKSQYSDDEGHQRKDKEFKKKLVKGNFKSSFKKKKKSVKISLKKGSRPISSFINSSNIMNSYLKNSKTKNSRILKTINSRNSKNSKNSKTSKNSRNSKVIKTSKDINKKKRKISSVKKSAKDIIKNIKNHSKIITKYRIKSTKNNNRQLIVNNRKIKRKSKSTKRKISRSRLILNNIEKIKKELAKNSETINKIIKRPRKLYSIKTNHRKPYSIHKKIEIKKKYNPSQILDLTKHSSVLLLRKSRSRELKKKRFKISLKKKNDHILNMIKSRFSSKNIVVDNIVNKKFGVNSISQLKNNKNYEKRQNKNVHKNKKNIFINFSVNQNLCLNIPDRKKKIDITEFVSFLKKGKEGRNVLLNSKRFITNPDI